MMRYGTIGLVFAALLLQPDLAQSQSVTRGTFVVIEDVQELMEKERYTEASVQLEALVKKTQGNPYDFAIANQYLAQVAVMLDDTPRARKALEDALSSSDLPPETRSNLNLFYGTVLLGEEEYELARAALKDWYTTEEIRTPGQIISYAYSVYMSGDAAEAEPLVAAALAESDQPLDNWYQLHYRVLFDLKRYAAAENVLRRLISRSQTNKMHWRMLANHYLRLERGSDALAVIMVAYTNDVIKDPKEFEEIVSLYGYIDAPDKGARLLASWIEQEQLPRDADTLKKLGNMWLLARERDKAKDVLNEAAKLSPDGRTFELLGGIYFEDEAWPEAHSAYTEAIRIGGLEEPLRVSMLAGISALRAGNKDDARKSLMAATKSDELRPQAESLLKQLDEG